MTVFHVSAGVSAKLIDKLAVLSVRAQGYG